MAYPLTDECGNVYGLLTVVRRAPNNTKDNRVQWECRCTCGGTFTTSGHTLRKGRAISCGCQRRGPVKANLES